MIPVSKLFLATACPACAIPACTLRLFNIHTLGPFSRCFSCKTAFLKWIFEADPVGVQIRALSHFKGLFKTFKMRYSTYLYSYWIGLKYPFQKSRFTAKTP